MNAFELYLILKLDDLTTALGWVFGFSLASWCVCWVVNGVRFMDEDEGHPGLRRAARRFLLAGGIALALCAVVPTTKQVAAIYVLSALTQDETVETIKSESGEMYDLFKAWLRSEIEESTPIAEEAPDA